MRYLVDTHILIWSFMEPGHLRDAVKDILMHQENTIYYSPLSLWEIAIKYGLGKLDLGKATPEVFAQEVADSFMQRMTPDDDVVSSCYKLPRHHADPFDRMLIWQAIRGDCTLLTEDGNARLYERDGLRVFSS